MRNATAVIQALPGVSFENHLLGKSQKASPQIVRKYRRVISRRARRLNKAVLKTHLITHNVLKKIMSLFRSRSGQNIVFHT